ncbi:hypothetical protein [Capnocytophaga catalasegens]|uniref:Uracil DNA glycosylase superfamily protein n=1 Tax=Capnocytophaga catalasegens TaxID=1004260 RepID=A0AAV5AQA4_9FLAO|nr:hypothetical protein [Capnocytophaga catalasegens]GIZ16274.1 hypothetical protein RCZ03_22740 [Capnocytophaga catalasegens]GJM49481.1 hypothetical protein RCZ15_04560 [Capnocytophaga catalasegens]GJM52854.1 hypothetical protein RCZ16_11710 [Capnocytophaga catalasegens]
MKTLEKLIQENERLARKIDQNAKERNASRVIDGIINPERYLKAKYRILWILKEANSIDSSWSVIENYKRKDWLETYGRSNPTLKRLIYTSYAILNGSEWADIPWSNEAKGYDCLQDIAFINIKKEPGDSSANGTEIQEAYYKDKQLLQEQINMCDADIVIFGNTLQYFHKELFEGLETAERQDTEYGNAYYDTGKKLYIWTWHPAMRRATDKDYVMDIVNIVKQWSER